MILFGFSLQFSQIHNGDELTRDRCLKYLQAKLKKADKEVITAEIEAFLVDEVKKVLQVICL